MSTRHKFTYSCFSLGSGLSAKTVIHDRDTKFTASFDEILRSGDLKVMKASYRPPNTNARVERFIPRRTFR